MLEIPFPSNRAPELRGLDPVTALRVFQEAHDAISKPGGRFRRVLFLYAIGVLVLVLAFGPSLQPLSAGRELGFAVAFAVFSTPIIMWFHYRELRQYLREHGYPHA